ncbi:hypothetical protein SR1949_09910 [Sphaerospermopsis reniformis]|jgi:hypothetical protein|uniref:Uncharacterized protein n=1 Tax=Sphaerospermopsis reniformis TaxID=531300 RepID=A0A479ZXJ2_9CYAN|nr:hypothetical protein SR1949_09910 [Sphaerospermopsis reniformis]
MESLYFDNINRYLITKLQMSQLIHKPLMSCFQENILFELFSVTITNKSIYFVDKIHFFWQN